ncbi:MAG TPA: DUF971 domain-containing protein [Pyrinomonadaceae bacterium]|nr:DUF971 domain-containing protein [Pyrinomonadaceae bacterium]
MIQPLQIVEESDSLLAIKWSDGTDSKYTAAELRRVCPCASCRDEWTGEKILDEQQISDDLTFTAMSIVGRYALNFVFSDNHDTGIFSFEYLNKLK